MRPRLSACIVTPAAAKSRNGNRVTALRWAKRLRELGWRVRVQQSWDGERCDVLVALHAIRSHPSIARHAALCPDRPRVVALTGTDLYVEPSLPSESLASIDKATRLVVLQPEALGRLPAPARARAHVIRQSATAPSERLRLAPREAFEVVTLGHLRDVKDPLLAATAVRMLPTSTRVSIYHLGSAMDATWRARAERAAADSAGRWRWLGERPRAEALRILAGADAFALTSLSEGGANVATEAIACRVPILSTKIGGSVGILGPDHPGYFPVGDANALAKLLRRCEIDAPFLGDLAARTRSLLALVDPAREREAWRGLLAELG